MSRIYESEKKYHSVEEVRNCLEEECRKEERWRRHEQHKHGSQPTRYIARPSYRPVGEQYCQPVHLERSDRDMTSRAEINSDPSRSRQTRQYSATSRPHSAGTTSTVFCHRNHQIKPQLRSGTLHTSSDSGDVINTEHGFTIQLDAKHFRAADIQISLQKHVLSVFGDRLEDDGSGAQMLRRTFTRKYIIPSDVLLSSIASYITDSGHLIIKGSRKGWKETDLTKHFPLSRVSKKSMMSAV